MNTLGWIAVAVLAVGLAFMIWWVRRLTLTARQLGGRVAALEASLAEVGPLLADTRSALRKAESRNLRADDLVQAATGVASRADAASKLAYEVATNPVVRGLAWARGMKRGLASLRTNPDVTQAQFASGSGKPVEQPQLPAGSMSPQPAHNQKRKRR